MSVPSDLRRRVAAAAPFAPVRERDLVYLPGDGPSVLVVACDSDGAIGPKENDLVPCSGYKLGRFAARVPLMELLAAGARPVLLADTLAVEMDPTGEDVIRGVLAEAALAGLDRRSVTGSTEDNVPTTATGVGVTVLGRAMIDELRAGTAGPGCLVLLVGRPKSAPEDDFSYDDPETLDLPSLQSLTALPGVRDIVPVGSHGVRHECDTLAGSAGLAFAARGGWPVAPDQSGGPGTTCVAAVDPVAAGTRPASLVDDVAAAVGRPTWLLGSVEAL